MCFAYFKMNLFERNPEKYIRKNVIFYLPEDTP